MVIRLELWGIILWLFVLSLLVMGLIAACVFLWKTSEGVRFECMRLSAKTSSYKKSEGVSYFVSDGEDPIVPEFDDIFLEDVHLK